MDFRGSTVFSETTLGNVQISIILRESVHSAYQIPKGSYEPKWLKPLLTTHVKFYGSDNSDISQNYTWHKGQLNCEVLILYNMIYVYVFACVDIA